jgi:hypothetical protein
MSVDSLVALNGCLVLQSDAAFLTILNWKGCTTQSMDLSHGISLTKCKMFCGDFSVG